MSVIFPASYSNERSGIAHNKQGLNPLLAPYVCHGSNFDPLLKKITFQPLTSPLFATHRPPLILTRSKVIIELNLNEK